MRRKEFAGESVIKSQKEEQIQLSNATWAMNSLITLTFLNFASNVNSIKCPYAGQKTADIYICNCTEKDNIAG
jgi:hypothetical protein